MEINAVEIRIACINMIQNIFSMNFPFLKNNRYIKERQNIIITSDDLETFLNIIFWLR